MRSLTRKWLLALGLSAALALGVGLAVAADKTPAGNPPAPTAGEAKPAPETTKSGPGQTAAEVKGEKAGQPKPMAPPAVPRIAPDQGC